MYDNPNERLSEAEFKEALEHIVEMKQYLLGMCEMIINVKFALIKLNGVPPYMFEEDDLYDIDRCSNIVYQAETNITNLIRWVATEEKRFQNAIENQEGEEKEEKEE